MCLIQAIHQTVHDVDHKFRPNRWGCGCGQRDQAAAAAVSQEKERKLCLEKRNESWQDCSPMVNLNDSVLTLEAQHEVM